jgi:hypothetical protein
MLEFLKKVADRCPFEKCGNTQNFIASVFQHEINDLNEEIIKYKIPQSKPEHTITQRYYSPLNVEKIIDDMKLKLNTFGCLFVDIDIGDLEHAFVLFDIEHSFFIMDSYLRFRKCEIRSFSYDHLSHLLIKPSTDQWNRLFNCDSKNNLDHNPEIFINYIYEDGNVTEQQFYENDIPILV